jgi:hypothetical protein
MTIPALFQDGMSAERYDFLEARSPHIPRPATIVPTSHGILTSALLVNRNLTNSPVDVKASQGDGSDVGGAASQSSDSSGEYATRRRVSDKLGDSRDFRRHRFHSTISTPCERVSSQPIRPKLRNTY